MKNKAFWMEFMMMVGVLLVVVAITLSGVVKARAMSIQSDELTEATLRSESLMEYMKAHSQKLEESLEALGGEKNGTGYCFYYEGSWQRTANPEAAKYKMKIEIQRGTNQQARLIELKIISSKVDETPIMLLEGNVLEDEA